MTTKQKTYLLAEPEFPIPAKSKNHKDFLPIGLLKLGTWLKLQNNKVQIVRGHVDSEEIDGVPDEIWITSLFTYWSKYVKDCVEYYKDLFPRAWTVVGGIYASLMPKHCREYTGCHEVFEGIHSEAEKVIPNYDLLPSNPKPIDFQIVHASRGCPRKCEFCGTWKIEDRFETKDSIKDEIFKQRVVFYDNNLLYNPHVEHILLELADLKRRRKILWCEAQSGFDGRVLLKKPHLGEMIKKAGFKSPRIAWDWGYDQKRSIRKQLQALFAGGYKPKDVEVFVLYNWKIPFKEMEQKRIQCYRWGVQIADCRFRPLDQRFDEFNSRQPEQTEEDYHIHSAAGWTHELVKRFRMNVRRTNICVRHGFPFYSKDFERKALDPKHAKLLKSLKSRREKERYLKQNGIHYWFPDRITFPPNC